MRKLTTTFAHRREIASQGEIDEKQTSKLGQSKDARITEPDNKKGRNLRINEKER